MEATSAPVPLWSGSDVTKTFFQVICNTFSSGDLSKSQHLKLKDNNQTPPMAKCPHSMDIDTTCLCLGDDVAKLFCFFRNQRRLCITTRRLYPRQIIKRYPLVIQPVALGFGHKLIKRFKVHSCFGRKCHRRMNERNTLLWCFMKNTHFYTYPEGWYLSPVEEASSFWGPGSSAGPPFSHAAPDRLERESCPPRLGKDSDRQERGLQGSLVCYPVLGNTDKYGNHV